MNRLSLDFLDETFYNGINENEIKIEPLQVPLKAKSTSKVRNKKYIKNPIRKNRIDHKPKTVHTKVKSSAIHFDHSPQIRKFLSVDFTSIDKKEEINDYKKNLKDFQSKTTRRQRNKPRKSFTCHDLEKINFEMEVIKITQEPAVLTFSVPFKKKLADIIDYKLEVVKIDYFTSFYKSINKSSDKNQSFNGMFSSILKNFPCRWSNSKVPYFIDNSLLFTKNKISQIIYNLIQQSIKEIEKKTCIKFVSYNENKHIDYMYFNSATTNSSQLGKVNVKNLI